MLGAFRRPALKKQAPRTRTVESFEAASSVQAAAFDISWSAHEGQQIVGLRAKVDRHGVRSGSSPTLATSLLLVVSWWFLAAGERSSISCRGWFSDDMFMHS